MGRIPEAAGMAVSMESWLKDGAHILPIMSPPVSHTVSSAPSPNTSLGHLITPQHSSQTVLGSASVGKRVRLKHFLGRLGTSIRAESVTAIVTGEVESTAEMFHDLQRFILSFMEPIAFSTLHIYLSALALVPLETKLSRQYGHMADSGVRVVQGREKQWPQHLWTASKHSGIGSRVAVSPDGMTIVSGSDDKTLCLWDAKTGAAIGKPMMVRLSPSPLYGIS
ncbi:hypothetical protein FRB94_001672 [Tulasnella sp. JGI-2019a]|nr:hypothetical protein FRB94_001672 [Tulasnella sp. JGI-2019a]